MAMTLELSHQPMHPIFTRWCAGTSPARAIAMKIDRCGSLSFAIRDIPSSIRPPIRHSGEGRNPEGRGEGNVARGLVPRRGRGGAWQNPPCRFAVQNHNSGFSHLGVPAPAGMTIAMKACAGPRSGIGSRHPSRHSGESRNPDGGRPAHPCHIESLQAVPPQPTVLVRSQFANAQDKLRSNLNSYGSGHQSAPPQCGRGACGRVLRRVRHSRIFPVYPNKCLLTVKQRDIMSRTSDLSGC